MTSKVLAASRAPIPDHRRPHLHICNSWVSQKFVNSAGDTTDREDVNLSPGSGFRRTEQPGQYL